MASITVPDLFTIIFVLVDDWYQVYGPKPPAGKPGVKPEFSDSDVITLMLAHDYIPYPSETQYIGFLRANYLDLFPKLLDQSQFNRRVCSLGWLVEQFRRDWIVRKGWHMHTRFLLDTKPVPVMGYKRSKKHSDFLGSAGYGRCVSRNLKCFGYKLVTVCTLQGLPIVYNLVVLATLLIHRVWNEFRAVITVLPANSRVREPARDRIRKTAHSRSKKSGYFRPSAKHK